MRTWPLRDRTALPRQHRGAGRVHGGNRDTRELTPPPAQKTRRDSPAQSGNPLLVPTSHPWPTSLLPAGNTASPWSRRSGLSGLVAPQTYLLPRCSRDPPPAFCTSLRVLHAVGLYPSKVQTGHITVKQRNKQINKFKKKKRQHMARLSLWQLRITGLSRLRPGRW